MRVALGGTFEPFHVGHEALLREATKDATEIFVGITDGKLAKRPGRAVSPWSTRAKTVESFVRSTNYKGKLTVRALADPFGPAATEPYDVLIVSPETIRNGTKLNAARLAAGLPELQLRVAPHVLGEDLLPISATAISEGRIDRTGKRRQPVRVAVGSNNAVKVEGVALEFEALFPKCDVTGHAVQSGVPEQPRQMECLVGARNRAREALEQATDADYAVGIEAGLMQLPGDEMWVDVQACVILDRNGHESHGYGPGFRYPEWVTKRALAGEMISHILGPVANDPRIGGTTGAIGFLSDGRMNRTELTQVAVRMALVPRFATSQRVAWPR